MKALTRRLGALILSAALLAGSALAAGAGMENFTQDTPYTPFSDVAADAWYAQDVEQAVRLGLVNGKPGNLFDPEGSLTLAEAITMAAKARSIYEGGGFTPGGDPWYENAVDYAISMGFLTRGDYDDYTAPAARADMAAIFALALPREEYTRLNRIGAVPDVTDQTAHGDEILFLYSAGILTGDESGSYHPQDTVTRAEAAAILNRLALPQSRRSFTLAGDDQALTSPDGSACLTVPQDWSASQTEAGWVLSAGGNVALTLSSSDKSAGSLADYTAQVIDDLRVQSGGSILVNAQPSESLYRGLAGYAFAVEQSDGTQLEIHCLENSAGFFTLTLQAPSNAAQSQLDALYQVAWSLDLAL